MKFFFALNLERILTRWNFIRAHKASRDVFFTGINQVWRIVSGPVTLLLIPLYLTPELQGYWFTILGLSMLIIFADLGFSNIILLFAAHEFAYLHFDKDRKITGDEGHLKRLSSFFTFSMKWAVLVVILVIPVITAFSMFLLSRRPSDVHWFAPWLIYFITSVVIFLANLILCFFEGCDQVSLVNKLRAVISIAASLTMWAALVFRLNLFALALSSFFGAIVAVLIIFFEFRGTIRQLYSAASHYAHDWGREFFPLLGRYAISFASGYFIFQIYTPFMFYYHGPVEAGKVGISIALWNAIFFVANVWIISVTPRINIHVSRKEWAALDRLFVVRLALSCLTFLLGAVAFFLFVYFLRERSHLVGRISGRLLDDLSLTFLAISWFLQTIINSLAVYLRSHKQEPLVLPTFVSAVYIAITTFICAKFFPPQYFFLGFLSSYIFGLPWVMMIYFKKRKDLGRSHERPAFDLYTNL